MYSLTTIMLALAATASSSKLHVSSYTGTITTFNLTNAANKTWQLTPIASDIHSSPNASYLTIDAAHKNVFCLDENIIGSNGSINSYQLDPASGGLINPSRLPTLAAPVHSAIYTGPNGSQLLIVAHYAHAITTYTIAKDTGIFTPHESLNFTLPKPGPDPQQKTALPHQILIDPLNKYAVVPDLGGDLVRVFAIDATTLKLTERVPLNVAPGSGPRHGAFVKQAENATFYYWSRS